MFPAIKSQNWQENVLLQREIRELDIYKKKEMMRDGTAELPHTKKGKQNVSLLVETNKCFSVSILENQF